MDIIRRREETKAKGRHGTPAYPQRESELEGHHDNREQGGISFVAFATGKIRRYVDGYPRERTTMINENVACHQGESSAERGFSKWSLWDKDSPT